MELGMCKYKEVEVNNMEALSYKTKIAVIRVLTDILNADNVVHDKELEYMNEVVKSFGLDDSYKEDVANLVTLQALSLIRELDSTQKEYIASLMGKMIVADEDINYNEVKLYNAVCESCNIEKDFNIEDYPMYSLSGPFVNPEDLI